jgi:hypothetical protein
MIEMSFKSFAEAVRELSRAVSPQFLVSGQALLHELIVSFFDYEKILASTVMILFSRNFEVKYSGEGDTESMGVRILYLAIERPTRDNTYTNCSTCSWFN